MSLAEFTFTTRVRPVVQVGIGDTRLPVGQAQWDVAHWDADTARWSGVDPTWVDITCDTYSARCEYGRDHTTDRFVPGVGTVLVNNATGWADPNVTVEPGVLTMRPGRAIRFGVEHIGYGTRWLFRGFIDALIPTYHPTFTDVVQLDCVDALGEVNRAKLVPMPPVAAGETVDDRIYRLLDLAKWPTTKRILDPASTTLIESDMGGQLADLLGQAADSGGGAVFGDLDANVVFRNRDWQVYPPDTPPDGSIGNVDPGVPGYFTDPIPATPGYLDPSIGTGGSGTLTDPRGRVWTVDQRNAIVPPVPAIPAQWVGWSGDVCPVEWQRPFDRADLSTRVILGRDLETAVMIDDPEGQLLYGIEPYERTDLLTQSDAELERLARRILRTRSADTAPRVRSVTIDARTSDVSIDLMSTVDIWKPSRYRCRLAYPRGTVFDAEHFATGAVHELAPDAWTLLLNLDLAAPWVAGAARWDQNVGWDRSLWSDDELSLTGVS